jgi:hypothetical protein
VLGIEGHLAKLQHGVPGVFQPGVVLQSGVEVGRSLEAILIVLGQSEVLDLLGERRPAMMPVDLAAQLGIAGGMRR